MLDASGIVHIQDDLFLIAEDESDILRIFRLDATQGKLAATGQELDFGSRESDFESLAYDPLNQRFYCTGSYSSDYSQRLVSFRLAGNKASGQIELSYNAHHLIPDEVDIEALATWQSSLIMGYRKPMYNGRALAVVYNLENKTQLLTSFDLAGRTFRDISRIDDNNYLILAGPEKGKHYKKFSPLIFWWDGDIFSPKIQQCNINLDGYRAEGIATRKNPDNSLDVLIGTDESKINNADIFQMLHIKVDSLNELKSQIVSAINLQISLSV